MKKLIILGSLFMVMALAVVVPPRTAYACFLGMGSDCTSNTGGTSGTTGGGTSSDSNKITISQSDLGLNGAPQTLNGSDIGNILNTVYFVAGIVAVIAMVVAGVRYTTANGDSNQVQAAKNTMFYAIIGLVVVIMAAAITSFVIAGVSAKGTS